jgi:VWFA-related protein
MKQRSRAACGAFAALALLVSSFAPTLRAAQPARSGGSDFNRVFNERFNSVGVENLNGRTEIQTWDDARLRVVASRQPGAPPAASSDAPVRFETTATGALKIAVSPSDAAVNLSIYVPAQVNLTVAGGKGDVTIKGAAGSVSVETDTGGISLLLPATAGANLSLRATEGAITSRLPVVFFGPITAHSLDGRTGEGGAPVILRSSRGSISLEPYAPARASSAESRMAGGGAGDMRGGASAVKSSHDVRPADANVSAASAADSSALADTGDASASRPAAGSAPGNSTAADAGSPRNDASDEDVLKVESRTVHLNVRVTDASGKLLPGLTRADFQVFEHRQEQEIVSFEPITAPVNLVLLLDLSGSTKDRMKIMKRAAKKFIDSLSPSTRISVAGFTRKLVVISGFTADRKLLKDRIDDVKNFNTGTAFYDSMWSALDLFRETEGSRKAVVVLSDGVDNSLSYDNFTARHPFDDLLARIVQEDVTIYPIYFDTEYEVTVKRRGQDSHEAYLTARQQLQKIADGAGGTLFKAERAEDLEGVYQLVASELQMLYSVAYNPKDKDYNGDWRDVSVSVKRQQARARTKPGYYAK